MKLGSEYKQIQPKNGHVTKIDTGSKFNMAAAAIVNSANGHNSVTIAHVCTKFDKEAKTDVTETVLDHILF